MANRSRLGRVRFSGPTEEADPVLPMWALGVLSIPGVVALIAVAVDMVVS